MNKNNTQKYRSITRSLGQLLALARLYKLEHPVFKQAAERVFKEISDFMSSNKESLVFSQTAEIFLVNGEQIDFKDNLVRRFAESFRELKLGSLELERGFTAEELLILVRLLTNAEGPFKDQAQIKEYLKSKGSAHIIPLFSTYKLVQENEEIVGKGKVVNIDELPSKDIIDRFAQDLKRGEVSAQLKKQEKIYQSIAHNAAFLSNLVSDSVVKEAVSSEEFAKVLWAIGDYLIDEIGSVRQEELNRRVLEELKDRLLKLWAEQKDKERWQQEISNTFIAINAALELKGLILLYRRHKKEVEATVKKLKKILEILPAESQLYRKAKEELKSIGIPAIEPAVFD